MKKVLCLLMVLAMAVGCISINVSAAEYGIVLNNNVALMVGSTTAVARNSLQTIEAAPTIVDGQILIPIGAVQTLLNGTVSYDGTGSIDIQFGAQKRVSLRVGSGQYTLNGRGYNFSVAPREINGVVMLPLYDVVEDIIGQIVFYDPTTQLILVSSRRVLKDYATDGAVIAMIANAINTRSLPPISVPTYYEIDWGTDEESGVSYDEGQLTFQSVTATAEPEPHNGASNLIDGNVGTIWAVGDYGAMAVLDLGKVNMMTEIRVAFARYTERAANYEVWGSEDNRTYEQIFSGSAPQGQQWSAHNVNNAYRYIKIVSNGSSVGSWNSIAEVQAYNGGTGSTGSSSSASGTPISSSTYTYRASAEPESENSAGMAFDGDAGTRWAVQGDNNMTIDLGSEKMVVAVSVQMASYADGRNVNYSVAYSNDGANYESVFNGQAIAGGGVPESHDIGKSVRYIRVGVNGSTTNDWASVAEIVVYGEYQAPTTSGSTGSTASLGAEIPSSSFTYTATAEPESTNPARSAFDGNADTFWAVDGAQSVTIDLGSAKEVGAVAVQMRKYSDNPNRTVNYSVEYSADGVNYTSAFSGSAAPGGGVSESRSVGASARYIRVGVNGSNEGSWASVAEIKVYGAGSSSAAAGYKNMSSVTGQFMLAVEGTMNVLYVQPDGYYLGVGSNAQKWALEGSAIRNINNGTYLDVAEESMAEGATIGVWEGNGGANQQWSFEADGNGYYVKSNMSGLYLAAVGGSVQQVSRARATKWVVTDGTMNSAGAAQSSSRYKNMSSVTGQFMLAVAGTMNVLYVQPDGYYLGVGSNTQKWAVEGSAVKNVNNGTYLDVAEESMAEGATIGVWEGNGGANQQWSFEADGDGYYVKSNLSGLYLAVVGGSVQQVARNRATKWTVTDGTVETVVTGGDSAAGSSDITSIEGEFLLTIEGTSDSIAVGSADGKLIITPYTGNSSQAWFYEDGNLINSGTELYMDVLDGSNAIGILVYGDKGRGGNRQRWTFERDGSGYLIKNNNSQLYIYVDNGVVTQRARGRATRFTITPTGNAVVHTPTIQGTTGASGYVNMNSVSGQFMLAVYGTTDVLSVSGDGYALSVGGETGSSKWSLDGSAVKNASTGTFLDVAEESVNEGATIGVWEGNGGANQQWTFENDGDGYYVKSTLSGLYLAATGNGAQQVSRARATKWVVTDGTMAGTTTTIPTVTPSVNNSKYTNLDSIPAEFLIVAYNTDDVLTVAGDNFTLGTSAYTQDAKQQWTFEGASLKNIGSGVYMDVNGQSMDVGAQICVWEFNGGDNQIWALERDNDGYYIKSIMSGLYLSVVGGNVQQVAKGNATKWMIANK